MINRLSDRHWTMLMISVAILLTAPSLWNGLQFEDYFQQNNLRQGELDIFLFLEGVPKEKLTIPGIQTGLHPWWAGTGYTKIAFSRPISVLTHRIDVWLWPNSPFLMHAHSLVWFAVLVAAVSFFYAQLLPSRLARLASLIYTVDEAHALAVGWIANRNILVSTSLALLGISLLLFKEGWRRWAGVLILGCGLLAGEAAVAVLIVPVVVWLLRSSRQSETLLSFGLTLGLVAAWRYRLLRGAYGVANSAYIDPMHEPWRFIRHLPERFVVSQLGVWTPFPPEAAAALPSNQLAWLLGIASLLLLAILWVLWRWLPHTSYPWLLLWLGGSLIICAAIPANRLLFWVTLSTAPLLAALLESDQSAGWLKQGIVIVHLIIAPILMPVMSLAISLAQDMPREMTDLAQLHDPEKPVLIVQSPSFFTGTLPAYPNNRWEIEVPRTLLVGAGFQALKIERPSLNRLCVTPHDGYITGFDGVWRGDNLPFQVGEIGQSWEIMSTVPDGRPKEVCFFFDEPLEEAGVWVTGHQRGLIEWELPPVGAQVEMPPLRLW